MHPDELPAAAESAMREAEAAFGDPRLFVEKWVEPARHVEVQILGLPDGTVVALGERECSLQRRYQKIVEESPSPFVTPDLREQLMEAAVRVARAAGYRNAGTVEFLVDREGGFYFMEVNARLQVEHPVTEMVLGLDLVRLQMEVALDESLSLPSRREPRGHAMEARLYAEDPNRQFLPQTGRLIEVSFPFRPGVRVDHGLVEGMEISPHYDPLLAKIIAWGMDREQARRRLLQALQETVVFGVQTNLNYLQDLLASGAFRSGETYTQTVANLPPAAPTPEEVVAAAWVAWHAGHGQSTRPRFTENREAELWDRLRGRWMP
ncbi:MAG: 3-methylcrotonyl-CoA carboxylase, partial [Candidatus Hydrothermae bacterium]|nr:3-methylcrotonyl-CoA carboxylase [Candidatus Hydrothermae bacterium]